MSCIAMLHVSDLPRSSTKMTVSKKTLKKRTCEDFTFAAGGVWIGIKTRHLPEPNNTLFSPAGLQRERRDGKRCEMCEAGHAPQHPVSFSYPASLSASCCSFCLKIPDSLCHCSVLEGSDGSAKERIRMSVEKHNNLH